MGDNPTIDILSKVRLDLDELNTPYLFDICLFKNLTSESLKGHIGRVGKILYEKDL